MRLILKLILIAVPFIAIAQQTPTSVLSQRAERAWEAGEWASAQALYSIVAERTPEDVEAVARLVVASWMRSDSTAAFSTVQNAMSHGMPLDSLLGEARELCYSTHHADLYGKILDNLYRQMPYARRPVAMQLVNYWLRRRNGAQTVMYADYLLQAQPDNPMLLSLRCRALLLDGLVEQAVETATHLLEVQPDNTEALILLGNYYSHTDPTRARELLIRAYNINPTPYLEQKINGL